MYKAIIRLVFLRPMRIEMFDSPKRFHNSLLTEKRVMETFGGSHTASSYTHRCQNAGVRNL